MLSLLNKDVLIFINLKTRISHLHDIVVNKGTRMSLYYINYAGQTANNWRKRYQYDKGK